MKLLDDIIDAASDNKEPIGNLLRKCLILERQLKNDKFRAWLNSELDGYDRDQPEDFPAYRVFNCVNKGNFYGDTVAIQDHPFSLGVLSPEHRKMMEKVYLHQPAASYEGRPDHTKDGSLPWHQSLVNLYSQKIFKGGEPALMKAWQEIPGSIMVGLLEQVRTNVLRFALDLKDSLPPEAQNASGLPPTQVDRSIVNYFYGGNNVIASNTAHVSQIVQQSVTENDMASLVHALHELGVSPAGIEDLKKILDVPEGKVEKIKRWAGHVGEYLGKEGVKIGTELAKRTALQWLSQYLGVPL